MMKQILVYLECCDTKCFYSRGRHYCKLTGRDFSDQYGNIIPGVINPDTGFPDWCPLDDVVDEPSLGDLTPEDIKRINETARQIKDAKNVREGRYG